MEVTRFVNNQKIEGAIPPIQIKNERIIDIINNLSYQQAVFIEKSEKHKV